MHFQNDDTVEANRTQPYTYFGWWLNKPVKADDGQMVEVFARWRR